MTLSTTTVGLPGIYLLICRAMIREYVSKPPPAGKPHYDSNGFACIEILKRNMFGAPHGGQDSSEQG